MAAELGRPSILRILEQALLAERFAAGRVGASQDSGEQSSDGVHDCGRRDLSAGENEVPERDLLIEEGTDALVDAFVTPAKNQN